jgi:nucleoid-associated protein YgaU
MRTILVSGGTLFHLAAAELGDATQWLRIARLNGLSDPMIEGVVRLRLPPVDEQAGGGIAEQ